MEEKHNVFEDAYYVFQPSEEPDYKEALSQLSHFHEERDEMWYFDKRALNLEKYNCTFEDLPKDVQQEILMNEQKWDKTYGPDGLVAKHLKEQFEERLAGVYADERDNVSKEDHSAELGRAMHHGSRRGLSDFLARINRVRRAMCQSLKTRHVTRILKRSDHLV